MPRENVGSSHVGITQNGELITISGDGFEYVFNAHYGVFESMKRGARELLAHENQLSVWRAPTDNDRKVKFRWYDLRLDKLCPKIYSCKTEKNEIVLSGSLAGLSRMPFFRYELSLAFFDDGSVAVNLNGVTRKQAMPLPRLGFEFFLPYDASDFTYFGMGETENYSDLRRHARMGLYASSADKEYVNYVVPQEHGNHYNTKLLSIDSGISFESAKGFEFSVSHYTKENLTAAMHTDELKKADCTVVRVDYKNAGIGSNSCGGGEALLEKYAVNDANVDFSFTIRTK